MRSGLAVLSLGSTRALWEGAGSDDYARLSQYARRLGSYRMVTTSYKRHRLSAIRLAPCWECVPTDAYTPVDGWVRMVWIGARWLRRQRVDVVQAQDPFYCGLAALVLGWWFRVPVNLCVYGPNGFDPHWVGSHWTHRILGWVGRAVLRRSDFVQVDGVLTLRRLAEGGIEPWRVFLKPVVPCDLGRFLELGLERVAGGVVRLLFVGRLVGQKNLPLLLDALVRMRGRGLPAFELVLAGSGPEEGALRRAVENLGLGEQVRFRGAVERSEIAACFGGADVLVLSSDFEGYARVLMEGAAAGLPIVCTQVSGAEEAVEDGVSGFVVPVGDAHGLADALSRLVGCGVLRERMGRAARGRVQGVLDPGGNAEAQLRVWRRIAEGGVDGAGGRGCVVGDGEREEVGG